METRHFLPAPALRPYIDRLWQLESAGGETVLLPTLLPGTGAELYFHYRQPFRHAAPGHPGHCPNGYLLCLRHRPLPLLPTPGLGVIAVRFNTGMVHRFTSVPGRELADRIVTVTDLWGNAGADLLHRLADNAGIAEKLALIQTFLLRQLKPRAPDPAVEHALARLYRCNGHLAIDTLAATLGLGRRQLERRCRALTGLSPRDFRGLGRFQHTVRQLMLDAAARPATVALDHGYYDQAHFNRDFRRLAGIAPLQYLADARTKTHFYNTSRRQTGILRTV